VPGPDSKGPAKFARQSSVCRVGSPRYDGERGENGNLGRVVDCAIVILPQRQCSHSNVTAHRLSSIGLIWPGTIQKRMMTCGKPQCRCHTDPAARHGPYYYWTAKSHGKSIGRKLSADQAEVIQKWITNRRNVDSVLKEMTATTERALELLLAHPAESE
jgi:hypothetical protein